jgi:hypothetical protein
MLFVINIFANIEIEKTKTDKLEFNRNKKYTETHQIEKSTMNEVVEIIEFTSLELNIFDNMQCIILPPSKLFIGKRFVIARDSDAL